MGNANTITMSMIITLGGVQQTSYLFPAHHFNDCTFICSSRINSIVHCYIWMICWYIRGRYWKLKCVDKESSITVKPNPE